MEVATGTPYRAVRPFPAAGEDEGDREGLESALKLAKSGDRDAFWTLVEPAIPRLYRSCFALSGTRMDAEDLLQEALLQAWRRIGTLRDPARVAAWVAVIATRQYLRWRRSRHLPSAPATETSLPETSDALGFVEWLANLSAEQRALLILRYYYRQPLAEIGDLLGLNAGTVRSRLFYLLRRLRRETAE